VVTYEPPSLAPPLLEAGRFSRTSALLTPSLPGNEFLAEVNDRVARRRLRWYCKHILPRLNADPNGELFVTRHGAPKGQDTLADQIIKTIEEYLGLVVSPC
jgi:hypothetical protein